jgi:hypothetical protein
MVIFIRESFKTGLSKVQGPINGQMGLYMKVNGSKEKSRVKEHTLISMVELTKGNGMRI